MIEQSKKDEVLNAITPICVAFGITDFDYLINGNVELLKLNDTLIGCTFNSVSAVIDEVIGYIFVMIYCKNKYIGAFKTQTLNRIKEYWIKGVQ